MSFHRNHIEETSQTAAETSQLATVTTQTAAEASQFQATCNLHETVRVDYTESMNFQQNV